MARTTGCNPDTVSATSSANPWARSPGAPKSGGGSLTAGGREPTLSATQRLHCPVPGSSSWIAGRGGAGSGYVKQAMWAWRPHVPFQGGSANTEVLSAVATCTRCLGTWGQARVSSAQLGAAHALLANGSALRASAERPECARAWRNRTFYWYLTAWTEEGGLNFANKSSHSHRTALHWACVNGHAEVVTFLVDRKCQLDVLDGENRTPLMKALQCQSEDCANILVDSGANLNIVDVYGNTALHYAVYNKDLSVVAKLLSHGAVVETQNKASLTPLLLAITKRSEQIVELLLTKNANANAVNRFKCTALMLAVCHGSSEIVGMLLLRNVDVFAEDTCGMTAVRYAIACGFDHIHQQLLEYIRKLSKNAGPGKTSDSKLLLVVLP
nr:ankyrin repeat domain-containing protein 30A-like [Chlorocebus sabaeus]